MRPVTAGVHDDGQHVPSFVHVHPKVQAGHVAESAVLSQLIGAEMESERERECLYQVLNSFFDSTRVSFGARAARVSRR